MKLFTRSWRFYVSVFFLVASIVALFDDPATVIFGIIFSAALSLPEILYYFKPASDIWGKWSGCHVSEKQQDRIDRARSGKFSLRWIDVKGKCACFVGKENGKDFFTTLKKCSCPDFAERKLPCKHMYYLADQLGILEDQPSE